MMRACCITALLLLFSHPALAEGSWMGRPISDITARVGQPDQIVPGAMTIQAIELSTKYGKYVEGSPYAALAGIPATSDGNQFFTAYHYSKPKLHGQPGRFKGNIDISVDAQGRINSYGSSAFAGCHPTQQTFDDWVDGHATPDCVIEE